MIRVAKRFFPDNSLAHDVANDVYLKLCKQKTNKLMSIVYAGKMHEYIYFCVRSVSCDLQNESKQRKESELIYSDHIPDIDMSKYLESKLKALTEEEIKFISIFVNTKTQTELHKELNVSRKFINETIKKIRNK